MYKYLQDNSAIVLHAVVAAFALRYITGFVGFGAVGALSAAAYIALNPDTVRRLFQEQRLLVIGMLAVTALSVWSGPMYAWRPTYYALLGWCSIVVAFEYSKNNANALQASRLLYFGFLAALCLLAPIKGVSPEAFNTYFPNSSRNGISAALIFLQVFYSAACFIRTGRAPSITPILTFAICVMLFGRSGIMVSAAIVAVTVAQNLRAAPVKSIASAMVAGSVLITVTLFPMLPAELAAPPVAANEQMEAPSNGLGDRVDDPALSEFRLGLYSIRSVMMAEYVQRLTPSTVLFGVPLTSVPWIAEYRGNAHNSFLRGHAYFGLPYLLLIGGIIGVALKSGWHQRQFFVLSLMLLFSGRAFFDSVALFDVFDVGFFYCFFLLTRPVARPRA